MVLTNFEFWAADGASSYPSASLEFETHHNRHLNPFDPRVVPNVPARNLTQSSNGYYGFSYINPAHDMEVNNNNNNNLDITNNNNNNLNSTTNQFMARNVNDVNGINTAIAQQAPAGNVAANAMRCKKRFFVVNEAEDCSADANAAAYHSAKRCRFDDDFAAQYLNDFFSMPSTQIATQSCFMDTEEGMAMPQQQQQQFLHEQQVDEAMYENNNNHHQHNNNNNNTNIEKYEQSILHLQLQQQQQQSQIQSQPEQPPTPQQQEQSQQHPYPHHQQQHYQDMIKCTTQQPCFHYPLATLPKTDADTLKYLQSLTKYEAHVIEDDNELKLDDATLFAQLHGGCLYHFTKRITKDVNSSCLPQIYEVEEF